MGGQRHAPAALPPGNTRYPLYRRQGGHQSRSGQVREISPLAGFDSRTVHPVASRYPIPVTEHSNRHFYLIAYSRLSVPCNLGTLLGTFSRS